MQQQMNSERDPEADKVGELEKVVPRVLRRLETDLADEAGEDGPEAHDPYRTQLHEIFWPGVNFHGKREAGGPWGWV